MHTSTRGNPNNANIPATLPQGGNRRVGTLQQTELQSIVKAAHRPTVQQQNEEDTSKVPRAH